MVELRKTKDCVFVWRRFFCKYTNCSAFSSCAFCKTRERVNGREMVRIDLLPRLTRGGSSCWWWRLQRACSTVRPVKSWSATGIKQMYSTRWLHRYVVYLCWPIAPSFTSPNGGWMGGGVAGSQPMSTAVHITWYGAQINFGDLLPYLTYVLNLRVITQVTNVQLRHISCLFYTHFSFFVW